MSNVSNPSITPATENVSLRLLREEIARPSPVLIDLVQRGFEQKLSELYRMFQQGECSLGYLAEQLGITTWETVHLLEDRGLRTTNL